jgi:hypothetical protein
MHARTITATAIAVLLLEVPFANSTAAPVHAACDHTLCHCYMLQTHSAVGGIAALIGGSSTLLDHLKDVLSHKFAEDPGEPLHTVIQLLILRIL